MRSLLFLLMLLCLGACDPPAIEKFKINISEVIHSSSPDYAIAKKHRAFYFPRDHGPHLKYRQEWWYFSGNLNTQKGRNFGFQLTFFRIAVNPNTENRKSAWAPRDIYMAHFAITDIENNKFYAAERFSRGAIGLAGATRFPFRVWLEDWQVISAEENDWPWLIQAYEKDFGLLLSINHLKRVILQGDKGLSLKSARGDASYHYSISKLDVKGKLQIGNVEHTVKGYAWFDREWSTSALSEQQQGWDWFALQLDNDTEVMFYKIRFKNGSIDPLSRGMIIYNNSDSKILRLADVKFKEMDYWQSPTGVRYPSRWEITIKPLRKTFVVEPVIPNQELNLSTKYYEGAVKVLHNGRKVGNGYVELVGYAD